MNTTHSHMEEDFECSVIRKDESQCIKDMEFLIVPDDENKKFFLKVRIETILYMVVYKEGHTPVHYGYALVSALRNKMIGQKKICECMTLKIDDV